MSLPRFRTSRLALRPIEAGDVQPFHAIWSDPEVIWWGANTDLDDSARALSELVARCASMPSGMGWWWMDDHRSGTTVGDVCIQPAPSPPGGIELGWHLARDAWGNGFATEGARCLLSHGWSLGLDEVIATIVPINLPSVRVAERLGMVRGGATVQRGGLAHGVWVAACPRREP